jgi:hypothetical protein
LGCAESLLIFGGLPTLYEFEKLVAILTRKSNENPELVRRGPTHRRRLRQDPDQPLGFPRDALRQAEASGI